MSTSRSPLSLIAIMALIAGCAQGDQVSNEGAAWMEEHEDRRTVDMAVAVAINEPNGGDYARAVEVIRSSNRPAGVKNFQIGRLVVGSFVRSGSRRPAESLQQGLEMIEQAGVRPGESREVAQQQLRMLFERGIGTPPNAIPIDREVAACWHKLENGGKGDPARCVALRRKRLPQLST